MSAAAVEEKEEKQRKDELHELLFGVRRSIRYHNRRRRFFDGFDKLAKVLSVIGGSAAVAAVVGSFHWAAVALSTMVAVTSAFSLVVGPAQGARLHAELAKRFATLEHDIVRSKQPNADRLNDFVAERLLIEADEPPPMRVLDTLCHNELCEAMGYDACHFYKVGWFQAVFAQILDLWPSKIKKQK
jgi:hypothetical protein